MNLDNQIAETPLKKVYKDGNTIIKVYNENIDKEVVLKEALNQARIERTNINIPKVLGVTMIDNKWAIIMECINGKTLRQLIAEAPGKEKEYIDLMIDVQLSIIKEKCPLLSGLKDKFKTKINESDFSSSIKYELLARIETASNHTKVCHGDINVDNVMIDENGKIFILDWSHVTQGNASADAARSFLLLKLDGKDDIAKYYLDQFAEKSGIEKTLIEKWIPVCAATQLMKKIPEEREVLEQMVEVVDY